MTSLLKISGEQEISQHEVLSDKCSTRYIVVGFLETLEVENSLYHCISI